MSRRQLRFRIDVDLGIVDRCRRFAKSYRNEVQFAGICRNVTRGKDAGNRAFHPRIDDNGVAFDVEAPFSDRSQGGDEPKIDDNVVHGDLLGFFRLYVCQCDALDSLVAMQLRDFRRCNDLHPGSHQLLNAMLMRPEFVAAVDQRNLLGDRLQHQRPVDSGITAAADQNFLPAVPVHVTDEIVQIGFLKTRGVLQFKTARFEGANSRGNDQSTRIVYVLVGRHHKMAILFLLDLQHPFLQTNVRLKQL
ncbi:hypothetical protein D3C81_871630 [compost metagenome]